MSAAYPRRGNRPGDGDAMAIELVVADDAEAAAATAAERIAARIAAAAGGGFALGVSGGRTPGRMFRFLADRDDLPWAGVEAWQADERIAPPGSPRNVGLVESGLLDRLFLHWMPVEEPDLDRAMADYAAGLPDRFDLIHLGLGADGHTASLVPGHPAAAVRDRAVALSEPYQGHRRMTLTIPVLEAARELLWLVTGEEKRDALSRLLAGDASIPAGAVRPRAALVVADRDAAGPA